jgi:N-carbamoylputrescine amidase
MRIAVVTNKNLPGFPDENLKDHLAWIKKAADAGARLVQFPELSLSGYTTELFVKKIGMTLDSRRVLSLIREAKKHDIYVAFGMPLRLRGKLYISHVLVGPKGLVGHYEKVHLAGPVDGEGKVFSPGKQFRVFDVDGITVGINICYDGRHPGSSLSVAHLGAEVILHPHGNLVGGLGIDPIDWTGNKQVYLGARSIDTCTYTVVNNSIGNLRDRGGQVRKFSGGAVVFGLDGECVARSSSSQRRPHMIIADLDMEGLRRRRMGSAIGQRQTEVYVKAMV